MSYFWCAYLARAACVNLEKLQGSLLTDRYQIPYKSSVDSFCFVGREWEVRGGAKNLGGKGREGKGEQTKICIFLCGCG